jgi:hypothetical protein
LKRYGTLPRKWIDSGVQKRRPAAAQYFVDDVGPLPYLLCSPSRTCLLFPAPQLFLPLTFIIGLLLFAARVSGFLLLFLP